jgi:hypothetical protein
MVVSDRPWGHVSQRRADLPGCSRCARRFVQTLREAELIGTSAHELWTLLCSLTPADRARKLA